ncbi:MAG: carboxypeptidase-like regulatory domain-containing protein [Gemmatimonadota bacterium]
MFPVTPIAARRGVGVLAFSVLPALAAGQTVRGKVMSDFGRAIEVANITVLAGANSEAVVTRISRDGTFLFDLAKPGNYRLRVEALGYQTLTSDELTLPVETVVTVELRLRVNAIALEPLRIVAERKEPGFMRDVRHRQRDGWGQLVTREQLDEARGSILPEILRSRGLRVESVSIPGSSRTVPMPMANRSAQARRMGCYAALYVNGARQFPLTIDSEEGFSRAAELMDIRPHEIEAIEIYKGRIEAPPEFADSTSNCGVVAIWLRTGAEMFADAEELTGELSTPRVTLSVGGGSLGFSGSQAPERTVSVEAAIYWQTYQALDLGLHVRYATPQIPAQTAESMTQGMDREIYAVPPGTRPMKLWTAGFDSRLEFRSGARVRPLVSAELLVAGRSFAVDNRLIHDKPIEFSSLGWGIGAGAGAAFDVINWFQLEATVAHERLSFSSFRALDSSSLSTAVQWSATSLRLRINKPFWRDGT